VPLYWFQLDAPDPAAIITQRIRGLIGPEPALTIKEFFLGRDARAGDPVFLGSVQECSFSLRRYIRGRNSFLPMIRGRLIPIKTGTRVRVVMFTHPLLPVLMLLWFGALGRYAFTTRAMTPLLMCLFGAGLVVFCFFPEALKAKKLLVSALAPTLQSPERTASIS